MSIKAAARTYKRKKNGMRVYPVVKVMTWEEWSHEELDHFETEYFNTGSEWIVHDEEAEPESPEDINGYSIYCHGWNEDQIRQEIADAEDKKPEEVVLFAFETYARIPVYKAV